MNFLSTLFVGLLSAALVNNVVLSRFLGLCPFLGVSRKTSTAAGMGTAVIAVITVSSAITFCINKWVLGEKLAYLRTIVFILIIAALVQTVEIILKKKLPSLYKALGVYLPLITTNCAVLGVALTNVQNGYTFGQSVISGFGTAVGYTIAMVLLAAIRSRIREEDIPAPLRGAPIVLIAAALMSMAFMGFSQLSL